MKDLLERFILYVRKDTQSSTKSGTHPSSPGQIFMANFLAEQLREIGMDNVWVGTGSHVYAQLNASEGLEDVPAIGFIAHMDTSPDASGSGVSPRLVEYEGGDVELGDSGLSLTTKMFPALQEHIGKRLVVTNGKTLLGADDKAGIAEIITALDMIIKRDIKHGKICVGFTPDEEIGEGADLFDVDNFGAKYAYTLDGGDIREIENSNFNAAFAKIKITGRSVHPGVAKDVMVNALKIGIEFNEHLSKDEVPEKTEGEEGFFHLISIKGGVANAELQYLVRDFDEENFERRKSQLQAIAKEIGEKYGEDCVVCEIEEQYRNMRDILDKYPFLVDIAKDALREEGYDPIVKSVRGGTDGANLSYKGLPCPNLGTGGYNFHGPYEYAVVEEMESAVRMIINIVKSFSCLI